MDDQVFYNHQVLTQDSEQDIKQHLTSPRLLRPLPHPPAPPPRFADQQQQQHQQLQQQEGYTVDQLEVLYKARGRQLEELTRQLSAVKEDGQRHVQILREKIVKKK